MKEHLFDIIQVFLFVIMIIVCTIFYLEIIKIDTFVMVIILIIGLSFINIFAYNLNNKND